MALDEKHLLYFAEEMLRILKRFKSFSFEFTHLNKKTAINYYNILDNEGYMVWLREPTKRDSEYGLLVGEIKHA